MLNALHFVSLTVVGTTLLVGEVGAQQGPTSDSLLARLTAEAVAANLSLEASRAMARAAGERVRPAGALPDPLLSVGVMNLTLPGFEFRESDFTEVDVELSQEFPWPGTQGARTAVARAQASGSRAEAAMRRREVVVRTAELYYRLRYVVTARATLDRQRALLATGVELSTARYATTTAPQSDPLQARVALARLDTEEVELGAEETELRADLSALRNASDTAPLPVEPIEPAELLHDRIHPAAQTDTETDSLSTHPRVLARQAAVEAADQSAKVEALGARPDFIFMTRYGARPLGDDFFSALVGVRVPLFAGRKQSRLADAARAEADAARASLADEHALLSAELRRTIAQVRSGEARLRLLIERVVPAADATTQATLRGYRVGQVEFITVLAAEDAQYRAELDAARVAAEHLTHLVMLEQLLSPEEPS
jgi:outer membrane protein TolC